MLDFYRYIMKGVKLLKSNKESNDVGINVEKIAARLNKDVEVIKQALSDIEDEAVCSFADKLKSSAQFSIGPLGYKKSEVDNWVEKLTQQVKDEIAERDSQINELKSEYRQLYSRYELYYQKAKKFDAEKDKISETLIKCQEEAAVVLKEAIEQASQEKKRLELLIEEENARLRNIREEAKVLKERMADMLQKYHRQLERVIDRT